MKNRPHIFTGSQDAQPCAKQADSENGVIHIARKAKGHTQRQWEWKFFKCGARCIYCGEPLTLDRATQDHLTPVSRGGSDAISNIAPACRSCNEKKGTLTYAEFVAARPIFSRGAEEFTTLKQPQHRQIFTGPSINSADLSLPRHNFELINEPDLLKRVQRERESLFWWRKS